MTNSLFREQAGGTHVGHSATSALLAHNSDVHAWANYICDNTAPMALKLGAAHKQWGPATVSKHETAYNIAFNTDLPFFDHLGRSEARMGQFAGYMKNVRSSKGIDIQHLVDGYRWKDVQDGGVVVDVSRFILPFLQRKTLMTSTGWGFNRQCCHPASKRFLTSQLCGAGPASQCRERERSGSKSTSRGDSVSHHFPGL